MRYRLNGGCAPIECAVLGPLENNVYLIGPDDALVVVDPSCKAQSILDAIGERTVSAIVLTHAHWDHVGAAAQLREATGAPTIASAIDAPLITGETPLGRGHREFEPCPVDRAVQDGEKLQTGPMTWEVMLTPGHTRGSMCLFMQPDGGTDPEGAPILVAGDTLFCGTHGRTDFEGGDPVAMTRSLKRLAELPGDTIVLPGHNGTSTIAAEQMWINAPY